MALVKTKTATRARQGWVNVVPHIHTDASTAETSEMNDRIMAGIRRAAGQATPISWTECFTPIARLAQVVQKRHGGRGPVQVIFVTDHMRRESHRLPERNLRAAASTPGLGLGAELFTRTRDADGVYRHGPEILAYGGREPVEGPFGPYQGLSQALIDELYASCMDDDGLELCTRRAMRLLRERGIAHGLSHPLDGHRLSLEGTLAIISESPFIETINGGYSAQSARMLEAFIELNNALVAGARLPESALTPAGQRIAQHIRRHGRRIHTLGASDAHVCDFDRAVTAMPVPRGKRPEDVGPQDFVAGMLALADGGARAPAPFEPLGATSASLAMLRDVISIVLRNARRAWRVCKNPYIWARIAFFTFFITRDEFRIRRVIQQRRVKALQAEFDPVALLPLVRPVSDERVGWQAPSAPLVPMGATVRPIVRSAPAASMAALEDRRGRRPASGIAAS